MGLDVTKLIEKLDPRPGGQDKVQLRTGTVDAVNGDGTLDVVLSGVVVPDVPRLASVGALVGDAVQVQVYRGSMLVVGLAASQPTPNLASSGSVNGVATTSGNNDTTSASFVSLAGTGSVTSFNFTKRYTDSRIKVQMNATCFCITSVSNADFGVLINGTDTFMFRIILTATSQRVTGVGGIVDVSGVPAGVHSIQGRWRRATGTGTLRRDTGDWLYISALEVSG